MQIKHNLDVHYVILMMPVMLALRELWISGELV